MQDEFVRKAKVLRVIDGDTLRVEIDQGFGCFIVADVRLVGVNTPENRGIERVAGEYVTRMVEKFLLSDGRNIVWLKSHLFEVGKYGRCICEVEKDGEPLAEYLLQKRWGWKTDEKGAMLEARDVRNLDLPRAIIDTVCESMP